MTPVEDQLRAAFRAKADEIRPDLPPLRLPAPGLRSLFLAHGGGENEGTPGHRTWHFWIAPAACAVLVVAVIAASAVVFGGSRTATSSSARARTTHSPLAARPPSYLGVFLGYFETGRPPSYPPVEKFAAAAGKSPNLVEYVSSWGERFATSYARTLRKHGATMIVQIDPNSVSPALIAAGHYDRYLRSYADSVRDFGNPVVIGFGQEMNADWWSWGYKHAQPQAFVAAWRHIVTLFRRQGADNVTWLWTISDESSGTGPPADWWPGSSYVTWVGIDGFYEKASDTFSSVFGTTIVQVRAMTAKPILLSQTAVARGADQHASIPNLFEGMAQYGTLGLVWDDIETSVGQDWHLEGDPSAEAAFRVGAAGLTLARP
jgi:Glycosyl hydrolase family 26